MKRILLNAVSGGWLLIIGLSATAQTAEVNFSAGGGIAGLKYDIQNGKSSLQPGFQAGVGYTRFLNTKWGVTTGLELGYYHSRATLTPNTTFATYTVDSEGDAFEFRVKTKGYEEKQKLYTVNIPLMMQFQTSGDRHAQWYARGGAKFSIPFSAPYQTRADEISASGYYPDLNVEITDLPVHGFGTQNNWSGKGDNDFKLSYSLAAEVGTKFRLSSRSQLYAGAYIDYGLNNIKKAEGEASLLTYHPTQLNQSQATGVFSLANTTGDVRLMSYGIKLRIGFSAGKPKKKPEALSAPDLVPAPVKVEEKAKEEPIVASIAVEKAAPEAAPKDTLSADELQILKTPLQFNKAGDTTLSVVAQTHLGKVAELLQRHPDITLIIEGHTCNLGSDVVNQRVGMARAKTAAAYLESKGVAASRLHTVSKADLEPLVPNTSEANRKQNRRIVFKLME